MNIILSGGGTAGHVSPALAVAEKILQSDKKSKILFIGREGGGENDAVLKLGLELKTLKIQGIKRKLSIDNLRVLYRALKARGDAQKIIKDFSPDVILGTGGYVCWPVIKAGIKMGIPTAVHESNLSPGLTTKMLASKCDIIFLNHSDTKNFLPARAKSITVGNPLRADFKITDRINARKSLGIKDDEFLILSFGGSIGAEKLNEIVIDFMQSCSIKDKKIKHIHAVGRRYFDKYKDNPLAKGENGCRILPYIEDMPRMLSASDVVISRAGAMTISEIAAVGVASILIPSPNVSDNHQFKNASKLEEVGAALLIEEKNLSLESLKSAVTSLKNDKNARKNKAKQIKRFDTPNAAEVIINELKKLSFRAKV